MLEHVTWETHVAGLGTVKATSALPFDIGVYLVVLGLSLMMFEAFGEETEEELQEVEPAVEPADHPFDEFREPEPLPDFTSFRWRERIARNRDGREDDR